MELEEAYNSVLEDLRTRECSLCRDYETDFARLKLFNDEQYRASGLDKLNAADELRDALHTITQDARERGISV